MITLTDNLKQWLREQKKVSADATDDEAYQKAAADALSDGSLSGQQYVELSTTKDAAAATTLEKLLVRMDERLSNLEQSSNGNGNQERPQIAPKAPKLPNGEGNGDKKPSTFDRLFARPNNSDTGNENDLLVRHVTADQQYDDTKKVATYPSKTHRGIKHPFAGQAISEAGRTVYEGSELDKAICGAYLKWVISMQSNGSPPRQFRMTQHDSELVQYALRHRSWGGVIGGVGDEDSGAVGVKNRKLTEVEIKALIDESGGSGGLELVPIVFDDMVIQTPLLNGEFFPRVNLVPLTRGRRVEGGVIGNVTLTSGGADATDIPLFNTASFVSAFDTTIHVVNGAIEIGLDFLSDSPVDVASIIIAQYGQQLLTWLDEQIVIGDGTTEPEGVTVASGVISVTPENGAGGAQTVGDYEALLFGVTKNFRAGFATERIVYGGTETTYRRARGIAVGATDARRVFGMTHEDYTLLGHPFGINEQLTNAQIFFANLGRYRMYRRLGLTVKTTTEGEGLVRGNLMLLSARSRYGGQTEDANTITYISNGQA